MKTTIKAFIALIAFGSSALFVQAQLAPKMGTLDLMKALGAYYKTAEEQAKLQAFEQNANKTLESMMTEGRAMADKFKEAQDLFNNPVMNEPAKKKAQEDMQRLNQELLGKEREMQNFRNQAMQNFQQGVASTQQMLIGEITNIASDIAKKKGLNMLIHRNNALLYVDAAFDITDEVIVELNKNKPAALNVPPVQP